MALWVAIPWPPRMKKAKRISADSLLKFVAERESRTWQTVRGLRFRCRRTAKGLEVVREERRRAISIKEIAGFCAEFGRVDSYSPGAYGDWWNKSYLLPLLKEFNR
jgi:hypothetical protein